MIKYVIILMAMLSMQLLFAQPWQADNSVFNPSGIPSLSFSQPRFADLDGDGDKDFLLGSSNSSPLFIINTGSPTAPVYAVGASPLSAISPLDAEMGVCADMDADGDLDLITGGFTGLHLFLNTGSSVAPVFSEVTGYFSGLVVGFSPVPDLADVDNDGDYDMVVGLSEDGAVRLYINTGTPVSGQFSQSAMQVIGDVGLYAYPVFCDFDSDNDQDILVGRDTHGFVYYQNNGSPSNGNWQANPAPFSSLGLVNYWNSPDLVDLNNDGLYDLVYGTASGPLQYYVNTGTTVNPAWQVNTSLFGGVLDVGGASSPVFYDFDGDGDLDLISGSQLGDIKYYENTGNLHAPAWAGNSTYFSSIDHSIYSAVAIGDVNADHLPDAIVGDLNGALYFHRNTGTGFVEEPNVLPVIDVGDWSVPRLLDMDGDGDLDLVTGNEAGTMRYYENQGNPRNPLWVQIPGYFGAIDIGTNCVPTFGDVDSDGDWDFVAGDAWGGLHCYLRQGVSWMSNTIIFSGISGNQNTAPALVDLDRDGDLDLVLGDYDGTFRYHRNLMYSNAILNPPLNLSATVANLVQLAWNAPATGSTSPFQQYKVYLDGEFVNTTTELAYSFNGLADGVSYTAYVTAEYMAGESVPAMASWTMNIHNPPLNSAFELFPTYILISWTPPLGSTFEVEFYRVYVDSVLAAQTTELSHFINNPLNGHNYNVQITARYTDGVESLPAVLDILFTGSEDNVVIPFLLQNWPNPFNTETTIYFSLDKAQEVTIDIFDLKGRFVKTLFDSTNTSGNYSIIWNGTDKWGNKVSSGVYIYKMTAGKSSITRKMILIK